MILSLVLVFFVDWFSLNGIRHKTLRELDAQREMMLREISLAASDESTLEDLLDSELFSSKKDLKAFSRKTNSVITTMLSCKWSLSELLDVSSWARDSIQRYQNSYTEEIEWFFHFDVQDMVDKTESAVLGVNYGLCKINDCWVGGNIYDALVDYFREDDFAVDRFALVDCCNYNLWENLFNYF